MLRRDVGLASRTRFATASRHPARNSQIEFPFTLNRFAGLMDNLSGYAHCPFRFVLRYLRRRLAAHAVILSTVIAAVACSVCTQYGVKYLVDNLSAGSSH